jgi:mRNA interferase HigB
LTRGSHYENIRNVNVISRPRLREFSKRFPDAEESLSAWFKRARKAGWENLSEVKADYPHADLVGKCTVFNIGGNKYRLIVSINYRGQAIFIKKVLTHREYDKGEWKDEC